MDPEEPDFSVSPEETKAVDPSAMSEIRVHLRLNGLSLEGITLTALENLVEQECEQKVGLVQGLTVKGQPDFENPMRATVSVGFKSDLCAQNLLNRKAELKLPLYGRTEPGHPIVEATTAFRALIEYQAKLKPNREPSLSKKARSRSPRSNAVLFLLYAPHGIRDKDIIQELAKHHVKESPRIVYIFTSLPEFGQIGRIIKLTFKHTNTVSQLVNADLELKGKPVLVIEPSLHNDADRSITHGLKHHQVLFALDEQVSEQRLYDELSSLGVIAKLEVSYPKGVVTFVKQKSAREAATQQSMSFEAEGRTVRVKFSKP